MTATSILRRAAFATCIALSAALSGCPEDEPREPGGGTPAQAGSGGNVDPLPPPRPPAARVTLSGMYERLRGPTVSAGSAAVATRWYFSASGLFDRCVTTTVAAGIAVDTRRTRTGGTYEVQGNTMLLRYAPGYGGGSEQVLFSYAGADLGEIRIDGVTLKRSTSTSLCDYKN